MERSFSLHLSRKPLDINMHSVLQRERERGGREGRISTSTCTACCRERREREGRISTSTCTACCRERERGERGKDLNINMHSVLQRERERERERERGERGKDLNINMHSVLQRERVSFRKHSLYLSTEVPAYWAGIRLVQRAIAPEMRQSKNSSQMYEMLHTLVAKRRMAFFVYQYEWSGYEPQDLTKWGGP